MIYVFKIINDLNTETVEHTSNHILNIGDYIIYNNIKYKITDKIYNVVDGKCYLTLIKV